MKKEVYFGRATHYFFEIKRDNSVWRQLAPNAGVKIDDKKWVGPCVTCAGNPGYFEYTYKRFGPFVWLKGHLFGFIVKRPQYAFTAGLYGFWLFDRVVVGGISYDFKNMREGKCKRPWGMQVYWLKVRDTDDMSYPTVREAMGVPDDVELIIDPHKK